MFGGLLTSPFEFSSAEPSDVDSLGPAIVAAEAAVWDTDAVTGAKYRRGELLVKFAAGTDAAVQVQALNAARADGVDRVMADGWQAVRLPDETPPAEALPVLRANAAVLQASLNFRVVPTQHTPNDEFYRLQWNLDAINMPRAWEINPGATSDVTVAIVDTGLNVTGETVVFRGPYLGRVAIRFGAVPDLVTQGRIVKPHDFLYGDDMPFDLQGHGTHVAGTIGEETDNSVGLAGVAYNVKLMPIKVLGNLWDVALAGTRATGGSADVIAAGIRYAADNGANVINLSLGGKGELPMVRDAIVYAVEHGAFVAISAGNDFESGNPTEYPAAYASAIDGAMAVGAVNRGLTHASYSEAQPYVEICAPGGDEKSLIDYDNGVTQMSYNPIATFGPPLADPDLRQLLFGRLPRFDLFDAIPLQGTSMAAPHISGVAALLYSQGIRDPRAIEEAITRFAQPISASPEECGAGLVDPRRTLRGLGLAR